MENRLCLYSIFQSIHGEVNHLGQGTPATFIRFRGCNLSCTYCDTRYANVKGSRDEVHVLPEEVANTVMALGCRNVMITGGEPLLQMDGLQELVNLLWRGGCSIAIETNGSFVVPEDILSKVECVVMDYKMPSSGMESRMNMEAFDASLCPTDFVKMVISSEEEFKYALEVKERILSAGGLPKFAISAVKDRISPAEISDLIINGKHWDLVLNVQLHKMVWPNNLGGNQVER